jgi:riboflavin transporter 2
MIGEGLSGLIPSFAALIQGVGGNRSCKNVTMPDGSWKWKEITPEPRFSIETFFYFLAFLCALSWCCFFILTRIKRGKIEVILSQELRQNPSEANLIPHEGVPQRKMIYLLVIQSFCCCLMNGILSALSTYSTLPYGNVTHHLATTLSVISGPVAVFLAFALQTERSYEKPIISLVSIGSVFAGYIIYIASSSPTPPLQYHWFGATLIVVSYVLYHGMFSYVKACIAGRLRQASYNGKKALFYYGAATQIGSLVGAIVIFNLMNVAKLFKSYHPCG